MDDRTLALARRAVACRGWRWMAGMRWIDTAPDAGSSAWYGRVTEPPESIAGVTPAQGLVVMPASVVPDLSDPATLGAVLGLVWERWGDPRIILIWTHHGYRVIVPGEGDFGSPLVIVDARVAYGEASAIIAALEAAPGSPREPLREVEQLSARPKPGAYPGPLVPEPSSGWSLVPTPVTEPELLRRVCVGTLTDGRRVRECMVQTGPDQWETRGKYSVLEWGGLVQPDGSVISTWSLPEDWNEIPWYPEAP